MQSVYICICNDNNGIMKIYIYIYIYIYTSDIKNVYLCTKIGAPHALLAE